MTIMSFRRSIFIICLLVFPAAYIFYVIADDKLANISSSSEVVFDTNMGSFTIQLYPEKAPKTVANFLLYVDQGFYTNTLFHRAIPRFVVQAGGFAKGLKKKQTHDPVANESDNGLQNIRGTLSMARTNSPHSATSQFFINLTHNPSLDHQSKKPGYAVFGKVTEGMQIIDNIAKVPTMTVGSYRDVPTQDIVILSAKRKGSLAMHNNEKKTVVSVKNQDKYIAGEHYIVLEKPVATRDSNKIEVIEMFSYGCPHCYEFESLIKEWAKLQTNDVDFMYFPAVWNKPMELFAKAFYVAQELNIEEKIHLPLFKAIVVEQKQLNNERDMADFFAKYGVDNKTFDQVFKSKRVQNQAGLAATKVESYKPIGVPEIVVNGTYRIDRMRAGGMTEMLAVAEFLINKERTLLKN